MNVQYFDGLSSKPIMVSIRKDGDQFLLVTEDVVHQITKVKILDESDDFIRLEIETDTNGIIVASKKDEIDYLYSTKIIEKSVLLRLSLQNRIIGLTVLFILSTLLFYFYGLTFVVNRAVDLIPKETETYLIESAMNQFKNEKKDRLY